MPSFLGKKPYSFLRFLITEQIPQLVVAQELHELGFTCWRKRNPLDGGATALHASKPGHLTLCKLMYGDFQLTKHFVEGQFANQMQRQVFVFKSVINQVLGLNTSNAFTSASIPCSKRSRSRLVIRSRRTSRLTSSPMVRLDNSGKGRSSKGVFL